MLLHCALSRMFYGWWQFFVYLNARNFSLYPIQENNLTNITTTLVTVRKYSKFILILNENKIRAKTSIQVMIHLPSSRAPSSYVTGNQDRVKLSIHLVIHLLSSRAPSQHHLEHLRRVACSHH
jgi:hypothetical protein